MILKCVSRIGFLILFGPVSIFAQESQVRGIVRDSETGETLIGANVYVASGKGTITDVSGRFSLNLEAGIHNIKASYVGFETQEKEIRISGKTVYVNFDLESLTIDEVKVVSDIARTRETPVAFSNVLPARIEEELGGRDIPMILNATPGVYATQQGGGDGDARITIRGFNQRNIAVMIDGIPVNDMENGWVYWSNWFGLDGVTRTIQVQRGLGASKLALPSVGGTMNFLTKGLENEREFNLKQDVSSEGRIRTSIGFTSGRLNKGWGVTLAGSYKRGPGWVENTHSEGWFYYLKIDKRFSNHLVSIAAMGAPQHHEQRAYKLGLAAYDLDYARDHGVDVDATNANGDYIYRPAIHGMGIDYNQHWGYLRRDRYNANATQEILSERVNIYHKPQFSLRDFWTVTDRLTISNIFYASIGTGGGVRPRNSIKSTQYFQDPAHPQYGRINWQEIYDENSKPVQTPFGIVYPIDPRFSDSLYVSKNFMTRQNNDHYWFGLLSTFNARISEKLEVSGGVDLRSYNGIHYTTLTDLLGGDYAVDQDDLRNDYHADSSLAMKYVGDTIRYYYKGLVRWGGVFGQMEYQNNRISTFLNLTLAYNGYKKEDYFNRSESEWIWKPGFTIKGGLNYNLTDRSNIFMNIGFLSKVRAYRYYYKGFTTEFADNLDNEVVKALELGYHYGSPRFSMNVNAYYTQWENRPTNRVYSNHILQPGEPGHDPDEPENNNVRVYADIAGMDALHMGIEVDFILKILRNFDLEGLVSWGDWTWDKKVNNLQFYNYDTDDPVNKIINFDATGIHVGDAAQTQFSASLRYEPFKRFYMNARWTYFSRHFSDFSPESTTDEEGNPVDSWKIPPYDLLDFHTGYRFKLKSIEKTGFKIQFSFLNVLNRKYITDAVNNDPFNPLPFNDFDAKSATVFFGQGRRFTGSFLIQF
jgi:outer membrane receptor for ferrienterochelin and colicin